MFVLLRVDVFRCRATYLSLPLFPSPPPPPHPLPPPGCAGEVDDSYGYGGTGKFSTNSKFASYGATFGAGDVVMAILDLDAQPPAVSFAKNGVWLGVACKLAAFQRDTPAAALYPHVLSKNTRWVADPPGPSPGPTDFLIPFYRHGLLARVEKF